MRITKLFTIISVVIPIYLITSCATTQPREKLLVGTWTTHKAAPYLPNKKGVPAITGMKVTDTTNATKHKTGNEVTADERQARQLQRFIDRQMRTTMKLNADKTGEIFFPGLTVNVKWKLKKNGKIMMVKDIESNQKKNLEFIFVNDSAAMAIQPTDAGDIIVRYRKQ